MNNVPTSNGSKKLNHQKGTLCTTTILPQISCYDFILFFGISFVVVWVNQLPYLPKLMGKRIAIRCPG
jgi:hypothetical protein